MFIHKCKNDLSIAIRFGSGHRGEARGVLKTDIFLPFAYNSSKKKHTDVLASERALTFHLPGSNCTHLEIMCHMLDSRVENRSKIILYILPIIYILPFAYNSSKKKHTDVLASERALTFHLPGSNCTHLEIMCHMLDSRVENRSKIIIYIQRGFFKFYSLGTTNHLAH
jgi:fructose/tagatose bisphosphate aldolase